MHSSKKKILTSTSSLGSPFNANWLHLARPGSRPANRIRRTSSPGAGSLGINTFFSKPAKRISVAVSKHTSSTLEKSEEQRMVLVSSNSAENPGSSRWAWRFGGSSGGRNCCPWVWAWVWCMLDTPMAGELWNWWEIWEEVKEVFELRASGFWCVE